MRIYSSAIEMIKETERELFEMGINNPSYSVQDLKVQGNPDYDSKELIGYGYMVTGFDDLDGIFEYCWPDSIERQSIMDYCSQEIKDRVSGVPLNPGNSWKYRREYWEKFLHNKEFSYTYSERMWFQLELILNELKMHPESRQCVVNIFDITDLKRLGGKARIPCSMYYHFLRRKISGEDRIALIYTMRSCDFYTHFPIDVWLAISMGRYVARRLDIKFYSFTHFISSLHAFAKDYNKRGIF